MAEPGAVVDVVGPPTGADPFLEEIGLLVGAFRAAETRQRIGAVPVTDFGEAAGHEFQRFVPAGLAKGGHHRVVVHQAAGLAPAVVLTAQFRRDRPFRVGLFAPDQRHLEALGMLGVVPTVAALHAEAGLVARALAALGENDAVFRFVHVVGEGATHAAIGADAIDLGQFLGGAQGKIQGPVHQGAGGAGRRTLTAGNTGALPHGDIEVEADARSVPLARAADDVVALDIVAGTDTAIAENTRVVFHGDDCRTRIGGPGLRRSPLRPPGVVLARQGEERVVPQRFFARVGLGFRLIGHQQVHQVPAMFLDFFRCGFDLHAVFAYPHTCGGQGALAHVHGAHAANPHRIQAVVVAEYGDLDPNLGGGLDEGCPFGHFHRDAIDGEFNHALLFRFIGSGSVL